MKVLLVEDEQKVGRFIERGLTEASYACTWAHNIAEAENALANDPHDIVILDIGLPDGCGLDLLKRWRSCGFHEPVVVLSARGELGDRIHGLNEGADDYLAKPFAFEELIARIRSLIRRQSTTRTEQLEHKGLVMNLVAHAATLDGKPLPLTNREYSVLETLMRNRGRVVTRTQLTERVWETQHDMQTNLIEVYLRRIRQKIEVAPGGPVIHTHRGIGYRLD